MSAIPNWVEKQWEWCLFRVRYVGRCQLAGSRQMNGRTLWTYLAVHEGKLRVSAFGFDRTVTAGETIVLPPYRRGQPGQTHLIPLSSGAFGTEEAF